MNAEALMPVRACTRTQAAYTFCCDTLTNRDNKHHAHPPLAVVEAIVSTDDVNKIDGYRAVRQRC